MRDSNDLGLRADGTSTFTFSGEALEELLTEVGGAVSAVFLREDSTKVMPAEAILIALHEFISASPNELKPMPDDRLLLSVSIEGAKSFCSDSPGWGAMGLQEITQGLEGQLAARGVFPPFRPGP